MAPTEALLILPYWFWKDLALSPMYWSDGAQIFEVEQQ